MFTINAFVNGWNKSLAEALAEKFGLDKDAVLTEIKAHKFGGGGTSKPASKATTPAKSTPKNTKKENKEESKGAFGKFKSAEQFNEKLEKAKSEDKYLNVNTGTVIQDNPKNRAKLVFYTSHICGIADSDELKHAHAKAKGTKLKEEKAEKKAASPAKKSTPAKGKGKGKAASPKEEGSDEFVSFGKFTTMEKLQKAHEKAVEEGKYVNAATGSLIQDNKANRNKGVVFYDSNVAGTEGSTELEAILSHFPGTLVGVQSHATASKASSKKKTLKPKDEEASEGGEGAEEEGAEELDDGDDGVEDEEEGDEGEGDEGDGEGDEEGEGEEGEGEGEGGEDKGDEADEADLDEELDEEELE